MPEQRSLAIEPARAVWRDWLAAAQHVRQLTRDGAGACEGLVASLNRWPSFAVADPWAIDAKMPAGPEAATAQSPTKRPRSLRETLPPAAVRPMPGRPIGPATGSRPQPGMLSPNAPATRPPSALTTRAATEQVSTPSAGALAASADARTPGAAVDTMPTAASAIAALVAEAIARHAPPSTTAEPGALRTWGDLLADNAEPTPAAKPMATSHHGAPGESRAALQAVDLPVRAALERIAQAEAPSPAATLLAPAAELLQRLLPRDANIIPSPTHEPDGATASRIAAPRAPSRLLADLGRSTSPPDLGPRPAAPAGSLPDADDEAGAEAISRLLAEQAWLRGVDFT